MEHLSNQKRFLSYVIQFLLCLSILGTVNAKGLHMSYYKKSCPNAEKIAKQVTAKFISRDPTLAAALLRMHFHDCFVRGCDGSVLLNSTATSQAEKAAIPNLTLRGFQVIDGIKSALEKACPRVVSCADILSLAARDSVVMINGPYWKVPTGRRDGRVSLASEVLRDIPSPFADFTTLQRQFAAKGLNKKDLVVLSGGHTIGVSHCPPFSNRLYNFTGKGDSDPSMDPNYVAALKKKCRPNDSTTIVQMDPGSAKKFDQSYYTMVSKRRGLFQSDAALLNDSVTQNYVIRQAKENGLGPDFFRDFGVSMLKMGQIGVLTGNAGEIRKQCSIIN